MYMIEPVTRDAISGANDAVSGARLTKSKLLEDLVIAMSNLEVVISDIRPSAVDHTFLGYGHPLYEGLTDVLLVISELQGPLDFSPQMLADMKLRGLRGK